MILYFRLVVLFLKLLSSQKKINALYESDKAYFTVLPTDLDVLGHMNNSRFLAFCDLARVKLLYLSGGMQLLIKHRIKPVIIHSTLDFKKELKVFTKFVVTSKVESWDDKAFYMKHTVHSHRGDIYCSVLIKGVLVKNRKRVKPQDFVALLNN
jgi:acyl-CoA thioesterase FadM